MNSKKQRQRRHEWRVANEVIFVLALLAVALNAQFVRASTTTAWTCTFDSDLDCSDANTWDGGVQVDSFLNLSSTSEIDTGYSYTWYNWSFQVRMTGNFTSPLKWFLREATGGSSGDRWYAEWDTTNDDFNIKPEGDYSPSIDTIADDEWHTVNIIFNDTSGTSSIYWKDSSGTLAGSIVDESGMTAGSATGQYVRMEAPNLAEGGQALFDNMTFIVLTSEYVNNSESSPATTTTGTLNIVTLAPSDGVNVTQNQAFNFTVNVSCSDADCGDVDVYADPYTDSVSYPISQDATYGSRTMQEWVERLADQQWLDVVDTDFSSGGGLAAVRWYQGEGSNDDSNLHTGGGDCPELNTSTNQFCVATDEHGNGQYFAAMASNQTRYEMLHNFSKLLYHPDSADLPCWRVYVNGTKDYQNYSMLCTQSDSASDADLRIAKAMRIACAKQEGGTWEIGGVNYCSDFIDLINKITQYDVVNYSVTGEWFLCTGYNNAAGTCPESTTSFRPDYYELSVFYDYCEYANDDQYCDMADDMLLWINRSLGTNNVPIGKTGHFINMTYYCDENCDPPYLDNADTWRVIPAIAETIIQHPLDVLDALEEMVSNWWAWAKGNEPEDDNLPFEIYSNSANGSVKQNNSDYKAIGMWLTVAGIENDTWLDGKLDWFANNEWDEANDQPYGTGYAGAYYYTFMGRGLAIVTGYSDPATYSGGKGGLISTTAGDTPFYTNQSNPFTCTNLTNNSQCVVTFWTNATGEPGAYTFFAFAGGEDSDTVTTTTFTVNILEDNYAPNVTLNAPAANTTYAIGTVEVLLNASISDPDGDNTTVYFYDGDDTLLNTQYNVSNGSEVTYNWSSLSSRTHEWYVVAADWQLNTTSETRNFTILSRTPSIVSVRIDPSDLVENQDATGYVNGTDSDSSLLNYTCNWYLDGGLISTPLLNNRQQGVEQQTAQISDGTYTGGQTLVFGCWATDGVYNSSQLNTSLVVGSLASGGGDGGGGDGGGGKGTTVVIAQNLTWKIATDNGRGDRYDFYMSAGDLRTKRILFINDIDEDVSISVSCVDVVGELCQYVELSSDSIALNATKFAEESITFTLRIPENYPLGKYDFKIRGDDQDGGYQSISVRAVVAEGFFSALVTKTLGQKKIGKTTAPNLTFILGGSAVLFPVMLLVTRKYKQMFWISGGATLLFLIFLYMFYL